MEPARLSAPQAGGTPQTDMSWTLKEEVKHSRGSRGDTVSSAPLKDFSDASDSCQVFSSTLFQRMETESELGRLQLSDVEHAQTAAGTLTLDSTV